MKTNQVLNLSYLHHRYFHLTILLSLFSTTLAVADDWTNVLDLRGKWKFDLGDDEKRASVSYDDSKWDEIFVPSPWEDEGYPGYDGYAWYRKHFRLPAGAKEKDLWLRLGCIDDVSEIYLNGTCLGIIGSFPPDYMTAYNIEINISIPRNVLNESGDNIIAVRVYDDQLAGGIVQGKVGLYESKTMLAPDISLAGTWRFKKGDSEKWLDPSLNDGNWDQIFVPGYWESQGYPEYDGVAWYRLHVRLPANLPDKKLILLLGKIDDLDEVYVNGEEIGHTGRIRSNPRRSDLDGEYQEYRAYTIRDGLMKANSDNVIAVRVYDGMGGGGIYEGPVGLTTREKYKEWRNNRPWKKDMKDAPKNLFDLLFGD